MATVNTTIKDLKVDGQKMTATLGSTNAGARFEFKLDTWAKWRACSAKIEATDLNPGVRTLFARSFSKRGVPDPTPAEREFVIEAPQEPSPPEPPTSEVLDPAKLGLPLIAELKQIADWNAVLEEGPGQITDQGGTTIRYYQPSDGERTELQVHRPEDGGVPAHGFEALYDAELMIPAGVRFHPWGWNTIWQIHGNNDAGYTGGLTVQTGSEIINWRIKGGQEYDKVGSHSYEYDSGHVPLQKLGRGRWHRIRWHALWTPKKLGFCRVQMDDGPISEKRNIPTASAIANVQMFRHGWYPHTGQVDEAGPLDLYTRNTKIYGKPHPV